MLFDSVTWRTSKLCLPASLETWTTYLPSGEMAAREALPLEVNRLTCIDWNGGGDCDHVVRSRYRPKPRAASSISNSAAERGVLNLSKTRLPNKPENDLVGRASAPSPVFRSYS